MKKKIETLVYLTCPDWADDDGIIQTQLRNFWGQIPNIGDYIDLQEEDQPSSIYVVNARIFSFDDCVPPLYEGLFLKLIKIPNPFDK